MLEIDSNSFLKAFGAADEKKKDLMRDSTINDCLLGSLIANNENVEAKKMVPLFGYYILGLINDNQLQLELASLGIGDPKIFSQNVLTCIEKSTDQHPGEASKIDDITKSSLPTTEPTYTSTQAAILNEGKPGTGGWETR